MTSSNQKKFSEDFYDQLDDDTFLGKSFEDEDNFPAVVIVHEFSSSDDDHDVIDELELDNDENIVKKTSRSQSSMEARGS